MTIRQKDEWDSGAAWWHKKAGTEGSWHQKHDIDPVLLELAGSLEDKQVLDLGCGNGYLSRVLAHKGARVTAIDLSTKLIEYAIEEEVVHPAGISYLVRDAAHLTDISAASFDVIIANMSVMDIADIQGAMHECRRVLKPHGTFIFSCTHPAFFDFHQEWRFQVVDSKKYFSRSVPKYLSLGAGKRKFSDEFSVTQYHRPISAYIGYLKQAGFVVHDLREIATQDLPVAAQPADGDVTLKRSKFIDETDRHAKEIASREIPFFLAIQARPFDKDKN